jgi:hypothetical protein
MTPADNKNNLHFFAVQADQICILKLKSPKSTMGSPKLKVGHVHYKNLGV